MTTKREYLVREDRDFSGLFQKSQTHLSELNIELTERCNNRCIHCYINQGEDDEHIKKREMTTQEVKKIVSESASLGCMTIRFTGGEPLLREDFKEIYLHTRRAGINVVVCTNATLISHELISVFKKYPPREPLEITFYGLGQTQYELISLVKGSCLTARQGIDRLIENKIPFHINIIRTPGADENFKELEEFAVNNSFNNIPPGISMNFNLRARRDNSDKNEMIKKLRATPEDSLKIMTRHKKMFMEDCKSFAFNFMGPRGDKLFNCGCGRGGTIDAYGAYQPCMLMRHPDMVFDLNKGSINDAISNFIPEILKNKATNPDYIKRCAKCIIYGFCEQCPAQSWMENGTVDTPVEYFCEIAHVQAKYIGLLGDGEKGWEVEDWKKRISEFTCDN